MQETILTLSDTKNNPFYEKIDFFKNHNLYFSPVSTLHGLPRGYQHSLYPKKGGPIPR